MSEFILPPIDGDGVWPSLGSQVADWMESMLAFGPGDLLGKPYRLDDEDRAILERAYQVHPPQHEGKCHFDQEAADAWRCDRGNGRCGRRRYDLVVLMLRKGMKKSERCAAISSVELAEDGPVRCDGFRRQGRLWVPVGRPVTSPAVWILAFAKEQAEDTSFSAMKKMIEKGPASALFDVWEDRIVRRDGDGEAKALASAPDSRDGGRTTFQVKEESHRWDEPRHHAADETTTGNLSKRPIAEPWEMHATTMYAPGAGSVAEKLHEVAKKLTGEAARKSRMFFYYRWADMKIEIRNEDGSFNLPRLRDAVDDASGPVASKWSDTDGIIEKQFTGPNAPSLVYAERVWLNRPRKSLEMAFDAEAWKRNTREGRQLTPGAAVVLSFDGSRGSSDPKQFPDFTGLCATEIGSGFQKRLAGWNPRDYPDGMIPRDLVNFAVDDAFTKLNVWRLYGDPPGWEAEMAAWAAKYGAERVIEWFTWRERQMAFACAAYAEAIEIGAVTHDGDEEFALHIGHAHKRLVNVRDDKGERMFVIQKDRPGSQLKIDYAVCGVIGWEGRTLAIAAGAGAAAVTVEPFAISRRRR